MTFEDLTALLPILLTAATALLVMGQLTLFRNHFLVAGMSGAGCLLALGSLLIAFPLAPRTVTPLLQVDAYALFYIGLVLTVTLIVAALSYDYLKDRTVNQEEFYLFLLLAALGAELLITARHGASLFLGLELLTVALYPLIAYRRTIPSALEAGLKYLLLSSAAAAFLLFGLALMYFQSGSLDFVEMTSTLSADALDRDDRLLGMAGFAMVLTGIGFKIALVPFHMWAPDVYQGAPTPVTAFIATASKGAVIVVLLRVFLTADLLTVPVVTLVLSLIAALSMFLGNLLALFQDNVKRMLAYSSIAHFGYLLVAFLAGGPLAVEAVSFYLVAYCVTTLGAFGIVSLISHAGYEAERLNDYEGLLWRAPWTGGVFTAMLLSLAGIPLTAGFIGKFYVVAAGVSADLWGLLVIFVINSVIGLFYYLRLIRIMAKASSTDRVATRAGTVSRTGGIILTTLTALLIGLGIYPVPLMTMIESMGLPAIHLNHNRDHQAVVRPPG